MEELDEVEKLIVAMALCHFASGVPPEWALTYPEIMYGIADKLGLRSELQGYAAQLDYLDALKAVGSPASK